MKFFSSLKSFFFLLRRNECIAITTIALACAAAVCWGNISQWKCLSQEREANAKKQKEQENWLRMESEVNERFRTIVDEILRREKIDQPKLMSLVSSAAKNLALRYNVSMPEAQSGKFFSFNKISINLQDVYFTDILKFDDAIELNEANLCIDDMDITINGKKLSAKLGISALDIKPEYDVEKIVAQILGSHNLSEKLIMWNDHKTLVE